MERPSKFFLINNKLRASFSTVMLCFFNNGYAALTQMLNDGFFSNPAELSTIHQSQLTLGSIFINPYLHYEGTVNGVEGSVSSNVYDTLPYLLTGVRLNDQWTLGFNALPSVYANLEWPIDSFVSQISTRTKALYYRFGVQSSYQINEDLSLGAGFNIEDNAQYFINFVVPGQGNQINSITAVNYTANLGLYYKINSSNRLTVAGYTQVDTYGFGSSTSYTTVNPKLSLNITQAPVIYAGLQHFLSIKWFLEEKIYWSGWSIAHNINFTNTTSGSYIVPTNWKDVWSFQINTRYTLNKYLGLLSSIIYETNAAPLNTNSIGYPIAATGAVSAGLNIVFKKNISIQSLYTYGAFMPNSPINNEVSKGVVNAHIQAGTIQISYNN